VAVSSNSDAGAPAAVKAARVLSSPVLSALAVAAGLASGVGAVAGGCPLGCLRGPGLPARVLRGTLTGIGTLIGLWLLKLLATSLTLSSGASDVISGSAQEREGMACAQHLSTLRKAALTTAATLVIEMLAFAGLWVGPTWRIPHHFVTDTLSVFRELFRRLVLRKQPGSGFAEVPLAPAPDDDLLATRGALAVIYVTSSPCSIAVAGYAGADGESMTVHWLASPDASALLEPLRTP
jgi:hypothetical protein